MTKTRQLTLMDILRYQGPEFDQDGLVVAKFTVEPDNLENLRNAFHGGRDTPPGDYHKLEIDRVLWMSDTDAERRDHLAPLCEARDFGDATAIVNGLGLGCIVGALLALDVAHVDVVEADERVAQIIGGWYEKTYPGRVTVHHADAYTIKWPVGKGWTLAWHDIWPTICSDNLSEMGRLHRRYGNRVVWQGSWAKELCRMQRERAWW